MRVMMVTASLGHGGAERHAVTVCKRLAERGHACHIGYIKDDSTLLVELQERASAACAGARSYFDPQAVETLAREIRRFVPDVVVAANGYALMYAWLALRRGVAPLVATYHSTKVLNTKEWLQLLAYRLFFWSARCTVFVCEAQRRYNVRRGVLSRQNETIHNGVDLERFRDRWSDAERQQLRASLGFAPGDYVIGNSGLLRPEKNQRQLVEAVAALRGQGIAARALLIGDGPMRGAIEARARELGVARHLRITGMVEDVRPAIAACDVMTVCSVTEAFSLAAIEAMAMGRPLVHSDVGGARELVEPGSGYVVPAGDTRALAGCLGALAGAGVAQGVGKRARAVVERRFSERTMVDRYERLLADLSRSERTTRPERALHSGPGQ